MDNTQKPNHTHRVIGPVLAECPEDGGRWAIYCEHTDSTGEVVECAILQDTNKARLRSWKKWTSDWCAACQELRDYGTLAYLHDPYNEARAELAK